MSQLRSAIVCALLLVLSGCLHVQLFGPVSDATVTVAPLRSPASVLYQSRSWNDDDAMSVLGQARWLGWADWQQLQWLGFAATQAPLVEDEGNYLVTAFGGFDEDADGSRSRDQEAVVVSGQWHAILTGRQLNSIYGKVSPLTEAIYRSLELRLDELTNEEVLAALDIAAKNMVPDLNADGLIDYEDVLRWHRHFNANAYLGDIASVDALTQALLLGASGAEVRDLSRIVVGERDTGTDTFSLSGSIAVSAATAVDGDVNDFNANFARNNAQSSAQVLRNPVVLGGYVNVAGAGEFGVSSRNGDEEDYFEIDLLAGQRITLVIAENPDLNDLDLYLYDVNGILLDASLGFSELEQLTVAQSGVYRVGVAAFLGASNYQLSIGMGDVEIGSRPLLLSADFVLDEVIADFNSEINTASTLLKREVATGMKVRGGLRRANLLRFGRDRARALKRLGVRHPARMNPQTSAHLQRKLDTVLAMKRVRQRRDVRAAELNFLVHASAVPNDSFFENQSWHYELLNLPLAWERSLGANTIVAVVDTGVLLRHPDLAGQLVAGYDFISSPTNAGDGNGIDPNPDDPGDSDGTGSSSFHGTHVAGTIGAASNNARGVAGVAWSSRIMPLRVLGAGGGTTYDVLQAVRFAAGLDNDSGSSPSRRADVINLSLSGGGYSSLAQGLYNLVAAQGVIVVAAAGNESSSDFSYPASYENVISVSAVNINRELAYYSNFGSRIDLAGPGGDARTGDVNADGLPDLILSTSGDDSSFPIVANYALLQGTSMAAPHVAGVVALMKSLYPQLSVTDFSALLARGLITDDLGSVGRDNEFGYGLINAYKAVLAAESAASGSEIAELPSIAVSSSALNFGVSATTLELVVSNAGTGTLEIFATSVDQPWLVVEPQQVDEHGLGVYRARVDRAQLGLGTFRNQLTITSNAGSRVVQVILQQLDFTAGDGDAGIHYVLLLDAATGEVEQDLAVFAVAGRYNFQFNNVPGGTYQILAGADADNDFLICDPGEACGAFPVLDQTLLDISVRNNLSGLNFTTTFNTGIVANSAGLKAQAKRRPRKTAAWATRTAGLDAP